MKVENIKTVNGADIEALASLLTGPYKAYRTFRHITHVRRLTHKFKQFFAVITIQNQISLTTSKR